MVLANLATNLVAQSRIQEARALYQEANAQAPGNRQTLLAWARMEEADRKFDAAHALLDELDALQPGHTGGDAYAGNDARAREKIR